MRPMRDYERILRCGWADVLAENITFTSHLFILKVRYLPVGKVGMRCGWARYNKARKIGLTVAWFPELTFCKTFLLLSITIIGTLNLCLFAGDFPPAPSIPQKKKPDHNVHHISEALFAHPGQTLPVASPPQAGVRTPSCRLVTFALFCVLGSCSCSCSCTRT